MESMPILDTREVLKNQLKIKIHYIQPLVEEQITASILQNSTNEEILKLLSEDILLQNKVESILSSFNGGSKEAIGTRLFDKIYAIEPSLCSQLTGMILELPEADIEELLKDENSLKMSIYRAKKEYIQYVENRKSMLDEMNSTSLKKDLSSMKQSRDRTSLESTLKTISPHIFDKENLSDEDRNTIGELVYNHIFSIYPDHASKLTGMILQMNDTMLLKVLLDVEELNKKIEMAYNSLNNFQG